MPLSLWIKATRPPFLSVTFVGVLLGLATAAHEQAFRSIPLALITLLFALLAQAGANVINDYYDALSGCDAANMDRIAPFTGGSRFIQEGKLTERATALYGYTLLALVIPAGLWLIAQSGPWLLAIGFTGLLCGWAYSAPPLKLQSRGLGELAIMLAWLAVVIGSDYVQSQILRATAVYAGLVYAPLVANVLFVNQVPDRIADAAVGKDTLIVRCTAAVTPWGSLALYTASAIALTSGIIDHALPGYTALTMLAAIPAGVALRALFENPTDPSQLRIAIPTTILSCLLAGLMLVIGLLL
jgi:1,4-dihydroxy-2-naphthoate octaprenyltransferase